MNYFINSTRINNYQEGNKIHTSSCLWVKSKYLGLGSHSTCELALDAALAMGFKKVNGCGQCCFPCYTR